MSLSLLNSTLAPSHYLNHSFIYENSQAECRNLSNWCRENSIDKIDLLYLDACGYELEILRSSLDIAKTAIVIFVATHDTLWQGQGSFNSINSLLTHAGFTLFTYWHRPGYDGMACFMQNTYYKGIYERRLIW